MSQIAISENESSEQFVIFSGGIPEDIECQNSICLFSGDNSLILNFDSEIINFKIFEEKGIALALFVLCQDEFVAIDLKDSLWRMFSLPYLHPIHSSPVTCILAISEISEQIMSIFEQISNQQKNFSKIFSSNKWPLERFEEDKISLIKGKKENSFLILTGHDNGNVCIWQANDLNFNLLLVCSTAKEFEGYQSEEENTQKVDEQNNNLKIPPIRKAGIFDPYSDDHRLCIQKICFDPKSGTFAVGGQAGQLLSAPSNQQLLVDMTSNVEYSEYLDSGQNRSSDCAIQLRSLPINYEHGFCLYNNIVAQFKPPVPVTAISWNFNLGILAAGNEFGYAICSIIERKVLLVRTLISSSDVIQISSKDNALSRFKSVKKSIRQSFRRKKAPPSEHQANGVGIATHNNRHRQEREITQRKRNPNALDGETPNSLIKVLNFENCILSPFITKQVYLFVGTQGGSVLIHLIRSPDSCTNNERCQLIKEIRLRHHAPIIAIELLHQQPYPRLIVFSEEQIRSFILPTLKPSVYKYKLTAIEGSKIKKATCVKIANKTLTHKPEKFLAVITNRGEVFFISPINTKFIYKVHFVEPNNTIGIFTSVVTGSGQIYYINSGGSEFVRFGSHLLS
ncbi:LLGL domain-containing protein [Meloidogyne graminicola]|uniref:LLGL domain-containing protein n=1 Tax=Meloidogyne graminicola TaxID=189291 RepID=A0A8T0A276_9BILA|nr:LLGL domain-containing protein [Meloidogyne graminicola]